MKDFFEKNPDLRFLGQKWSKWTQNTQVFIYSKNSYNT